MLKFNNIKEFVMFSLFRVVDSSISWKTMYKKCRTCAQNLENDEAKEDPLVRLTAARLLAAVYEVYHLVEEVGRGVVERQARAVDGYDDERLLGGQGDAQVLLVARDPLLQLLGLRVGLATLALAAEDHQVVIAVEHQENRRETVAQLHVARAIEEQPLHGKELPFGVSGHLVRQEVDDPVGLLKEVFDCVAVRAGHGCLRVWCPVAWAFRWPTLSARVTCAPAASSRMIGDGLATPRTPARGCPPRSAEP